jgi:hypothetical protein
VPPFTGSVKIYNSAGELVATLYQQLPLYHMPLGLEAVSPSFVPDLGGAGVLKLVGPDLPLVWTGGSDRGQTVDSGVYNVVVQVVDPFGKATSWSGSLTVLRSDVSTAVEVYNSAGELVWAEHVLPQSPGIVGISGRELVPDAGGPGLKISYGNASADFLNWHGTGMQGQALSSGSYLVKVTQAGSGGSSTTSFTVTLLQPNTQVFAWLAAAPNPVPAAASSLMVSLQGAAPGISAGGEAFNLAGEHVGSLTAVPGSYLRWDIPTTLAPGVYILQISARDAQGRLKSAPIKVAIVR